MIGFIIWALAGCCFAGLGIYAFFSKNAMPFWANTGMFAVSDVRRYNRAMGKCWCVFGGVFIALGLPLLAGQNTPFVLLSVLGVVVETIAFMAIYTLVIEKKYRKT